MIASALALLFAASPGGSAVDVPGCPGVSARVVVRGQVRASLAGEILVVELRSADGATVGERRVAGAHACADRARAIGALAEAWALDLTLSAAAAPEPEPAPPALPPWPPPPRARAPGPTSTERAPRSLRAAVPASAGPALDPSPEGTSLRRAILPSTQPEPVSRRPAEAAPDGKPFAWGWALVGVSVLAVGVTTSVIEDGEPFTREFLPFALYTSGALILIAALVDP